MKRTEIIDVLADKAQYSCGEAVNISIAYINSYEKAFLCIEILEDFEVIHKEMQSIKPCNEPCSIMVSYEIKATKWQGFGVECRIIFDNRAISEFDTSFDVVPDSKCCLRYGFISNFGTDDKNNFKDIEWLNRLHINVAQFYDWMYRHEDLLPSGDQYTDVMGRELSLTSVKNKIEACHQYGIKTTAYGAIYASSKGFYESHTPWGMLDNDKNPITLSGWLYLMDISPESGWTKHITSQFAEAMGELGFDGIHLDTYGFPHKYYLSDGALVDYRDVINPFLGKVREEMSKIDSDGILIYNNVNNFPTDTVVKSTVDAVYIEVWDPNSTYRNLYELCRNVRMQCGKPIILAAYIESFAGSAERAHKMNALLYTTAVIFASGAHHLVMGGYRGLLHSPYYAEYSLLDENEADTILRYYNYIVRYGHILLDPELRDITMTATGGINDGFGFYNCEPSNTPEAGKVWTLIKERDNYIVIHLINFCGLCHDQWNKPQNAPAPICDIKVEALIYDKVLSVDIASPDWGYCSAKKAAYHFEACKQGVMTVFTVPRVDFWTTVFIRVNE